MSYTDHISQRERDRLNLLTTKQRCMEVAEMGGNIPQRCVAENWQASVEYDERDTPTLYLGEEIIFMYGV
jgi:hypothetical protein